MLATDDPLRALLRVEAEETTRLRSHYAAGTFLTSGRKVPRDGGVILAIGHDRAQIEAIVREDPFVARGLADDRLIELRESRRADDLPKRIA